MCLTRDEQKTALDAHNSERNSRSSPSLVYDTSLEQSAQIVANGLASGGSCSLKHSGLPGVGENLFSSSASSKSAITKGIKAWIDEKKDYRTAQFTSGTGHFTQVVWKATKKVGCAVAGKSCSVLVCHYSPQGNVQGQFPQNAPV